MNRKRRKFLAFLLCFSMILSICPKFSIQASNYCTVTNDGYAVENVVLPQNERIQLTANTSVLGDGEYQWQILAFGSIWVDIAGAKGENLDLSYAMVANLLENDEATVRCKVVNGDTISYSTEVAVEIDYAVEEIEIDQNFEPIIVSPGNVIVSGGSNDSVTDDDEQELATDSEANYEPEVETPSDAEQEVETPSDATPKMKTEAPRRMMFALARNSEAPAETYNVVVNYLFENNEIVDMPFTATLAAGSNFSATVTFPEAQGYLAYLGKSEVATTSLDLDITNIQDDVTYTVTYKPTNVNYTVIHYKQNLDNDNYTETERETLQGLTNSSVPEVANEYEGFYALLYEKPAIAADGSTVVEIYYDRYYYLMNFNLGENAYGTEPVYARYGASLDDISNPTRAGYTFLGWSLNGTDVVTLPETMPAENKTYIALWQVAETAKVSVVFWGENPNDEEYSYLTTGVVEVAPGTVYKFADGNEVFLICGKDNHTHTEECISCGKEEHTEHTEDCLICGQTYHVHDKYCYEGVGNKFEGSFGERGVRGNETNGYIGESYNITITGTGNKYIYINGTWYKYTGSASVGSSVNPSCGITENLHEHNNSCYGCEYHEHTTSCYSCGMDEHIHNNSCNQTGSGLERDKWTFVRSETVTVAADGSTVVNVYYDRVEYTVNFYSNSNLSNEYTNYRITAKWGANILDKWPTHNRSSSWYVPNKNNTWQNSIQVMPIGGTKFYGPRTGNSNYIAYYYVEALPGDTNTNEYNGVTYKLHHSDISSSNGTVTDEERYTIEGFDYKEGTANGQSYNGAKFYYTRHKYVIEFYSPTTLLKKTENVPYEFPLSSYTWTPEASQAPAKYEPGSVKFEGWYLNPECTGDKFDFATHTMPAGTEDGDTTLTLYAKWVPETRTVTFYLDQTAYEAGTVLTTHPAVTVNHGSKVTPKPADPTNGSYTFVGWFYMEDGVEKAFDFANMTVNKDLQVYGKWSSNVLKEYTILYKYEDSETGVAVEIADPITGSGLAGITKTFDAKGGEDLYIDYREGYFPVVKSHSLTIDINATEENDTNVYTFWYVQKDAVPYTVKYLNAETGETVATEKVVSENRKAVVTETFVPVQGMMPDAYQKRLVVDGSDGAVNEIIFYYTEDTTHAYYKITHYTQNTDGKTWSEHASSEAIGDIGTTYTAEPITINGFRYDSTVDGTVVSGELTANGLELKLYYVRNEYPYMVRYLEEGSGKQLAEPKNETGRYGEIISESAIDIAGYTAVEPTSQTLTIRIEDTPNLNVITFYYKLALVDLTIEKSGADTTLDKDQTFIFNVKGTDTNTSGIDMTVVITGNDSVTIRDLPVGSYVITEDENWSWRYTATENLKTVDLTSSQTVIIENERDKEKWIDSNGIISNIFNKLTGAS